MITITSERVPLHTDSGVNGDLAQAAQAQTRLVDDAGSYAESNRCTG